MEEIQGKVKWHAQDYLSEKWHKMHQELVTLVLETDNLTPFTAHSTISADIYFNAF